VDFTTLEGYLSMELFSMFYPVLVLAFAVSYGAGLLGGEEESGTLELLLATPTPRWHVVLSKFAALVTFTVIVLLATWLGILAGAVVADIEDVDAANLFVGVFNMAPLALFFAALAYMLTGVIGGRGAAPGVPPRPAAATHPVSARRHVGGPPGGGATHSPCDTYERGDV